MQKHHIDLQYLLKNKPAIDKFNKINQADIMKMWCYKGDPKIDPFNLPEYTYECPLYQKMLYRFKNEGYCVIGLYNGITGGFQNQMLSYVGINPYFNDTQWTDFFHMVKYGIGGHDLDQMNLTDKKALWKQNVIEFFYNIDPEQQKVLIDRYNKTYVDTYNDMFKKIDI